MTRVLVAGGSIGVTSRARAAGLGPRGLVALAPCGGCGLSARWAVRLQPGLSHARALRRRDPPAGEGLRGASSRGRISRRPASGRRSSAGHRPGSPCCPRRRPMPDDGVSPAVRVDPRCPTPVSKVYLEGFVRARVANGPADGAVIIRSQRSSDRASGPHRPRGPRGRRRHPEGRGRAAGQELVRPGSRHVATAAEDARAEVGPWAALAAERLDRAAPGRRRSRPRRGRRGQRRWPAG